MHCEIRSGKGFQRVFVDFNIFATLPLHERREKIKNLVAILSTRR